MDSNLCGHDSHGVWLVPRYVGTMRDGGYVGWEAREVVRESATLAVIDGHGANGIVAMTNVIDLVVEKARASTFGAVALRDVTHIARLGHYTPLVAEQGMVAMLWTNVGGMFMSPFGSADRRLRPSPMSFSVPRRAGPPFMLDMSLSVVAGGKIRQMVANDKPLPDGWLIDQEGRYLSDGRRYDDLDTAILPLGDMQFGHKGYGLNMMMEMIVGPLSLAGCTRSESESEGGGGVMLLADRHRGVHRDGLLHGRGRGAGRLGALGEAAARLRAGVRPWGDRGGDAPEPAPGWCGYTRRLLGGRVQGGRRPRRDRSLAV